jgi:hypothetical protein
MDYPKSLQLIVITLVLMCASVAAHATDWGNLLTYFNASDAYPTKEAFFGWDQCWDDQFDNQPIGPHDVPGLPTICQPDTLYTWEGPRTLAMLKSEAGDEKPWAKYFDKEIFSHINPVATFGYGPMAFRYKLKPGTQFYLYTDNQISTDGDGLCEQLKVAQQENTIVVRAWKNDSTSGVDYLICSPQVIESWSYDTKTHYDEIIASLNWNFDQTKTDATVNNWIPYTITSGTADFFDSGLDSRDWSRDYLLKNLTKMRADAQSTGGNITYAAGVPHISANHYKTTRPIYWNTKTQ